MDRVSVDGGVVGRVRAHLHRQRVGGGRGKGDLGRVGGSCEMEWRTRWWPSFEGGFDEVSHRARSIGG